MSSVQQSAGNTQPSSKRFWQDHIERQCHSGLTQVAYCRQNGLNKNTFVYWKSRFKKPKDVLRPFLPVSITPDSGTAADKRKQSSFSSGISLSFDDRFDVRLEVGFNCDTLSRLIDMLEAR